MVLHIYYKSFGFFLLFKTTLKKGKVQLTLFKGISQPQPLEPEQARRERLQHFFSRVSGILGSSLDPSTIVKSVAEIIVPVLGDWCFIYIPEGNGYSEGIEIEHQDPEKRDLAYKIYKQYPPDLKSSHGITKALKTGKPELYEEITDSLLQRAARSQIHLKLLKTLNLKSLLIVPLKTKHKTLGVISCAMSESGRRYTEDHLLLLESLGRRIASAIDKARLYRKAQIDLASQKRIINALRTSEERYRRVVELAPDLIYTTEGEENIITSLSPSFEKITGWRIAEWIGVSIQELLHPDDQDLATQKFKQISHKKTAEPFRLRLLSKSGQYLIFEFRGAPKLKKGATTGIVGIARDVTRRREVEEKPIRLTLLYNMLSEINEVVVRLENKEELFNEACRIIVENGLFRMAWIGIVDWKTQKVRPVASCGHGKESAKEFRVSVREDDPRGRGITGTAIRNKHFVVANDLATDDSVSPWRDQALKLGYRSAASFPLMVKGEAIGVLVVNADQPRFFDTEEISLLERLALDLSFALEALDRKEELSSSQDLLEKINQAAPKLLAPLTLEGIYTTVVNEGLNLVGGYDGKILLKRGKFLKAAYSSSKEADRVTHRKRGFTYRAFIKRRAFSLPLERFAQHHPEVESQGIKSVLFIPLSHKSKAFGVLLIRFLEEHSFTERELELFSLFGSMASLAIRNTELLEETQKALKTRDLFVKTASHELRTPLTTINGYVSLLKNSIKDKKTREGRWIKELSWETERMNGLVKELLTISQIKTGKLQYHWKECNLKELVNRVLLEFSFNHPQHKVQIHDQLKDKGSFITGDFDKLLQVMSNILDNAAKFSPAGSVIDIFLKEKNRQIVLAVKDKGKGIEKKDLPNVFKEFYRTGASSDDTGMGLGLFLVKNIIDRHQGKISIKSKPNKGAMVQITLPAIKYD